MPTPTLVDIDHLTIADALRHLADGSLSSEALVSAYLERARAHAALNIFITLDGEGALAAARAVDAARRAGRPLGPLAGIPV
ncbi:amidase family protein, partial [Zoogloea sp.]|uniref:amidase family protein n=1 Tax=Zoogloea sp. TaxID=49181 RepID=UPI0035B198AE